MNSYYYKAENVVKAYILSDTFIPYTSIFCGLFISKLCYDLTQLISPFYCKCYTSLTKIQRIEWNNRGMSTLHAIFVSTISLYLVFYSDMFSNDPDVDDLVTFRSSPISSFSLGVSVGYFIADLGMICWLYPSLGGIEYVLHHLLSAGAISYSIFSGEGQFYTFMVLISEITTPGVNLRWYLDTVGLKKSKAYTVNGVAVFFVWLVARVLLFVYTFYHIYLHFNQVQNMHIIGILLVILVPSTLAVMNLIWFMKIVKGIKKAIIKRQ